MRVRILAGGVAPSAQRRRVPLAPAIRCLPLIPFLLLATSSAHAADSPSPDAAPDSPSASTSPDLPAPSPSPGEEAGASSSSDAPSSSASSADEAERARLEAELGASLGAVQPPPAALGFSHLPAAGKIIPDISLIGTFAGAWFSDDPTLRLRAHEPVHRGPQLQEIELALQANIDPFVRADVFLALSLGGIEVEEAYATTLGLPWNLQLRAGQMYAPFGRFNQLHFLEVTPFADMPLPNRRFFGGEQLRGVGAEGSWLLPLPFFVEVRAAALTAGNEVSFGVPGGDIERVTDLLGVARILTSLDLSGRLSVNLGASVANGPNSSGGLLVTDRNRTDVLGGDLYLRLRDQSSRAFTALQTEYLYRRSTTPGGRLEQGGAYAWLVRRFDAEWEAAFRYDFLGLPDGRAVGDPVPDGEIAPFLLPASQQRVGAAISYYPSEFQRIRLQANYDFGLETPDAPAGGVQEYFIQYQFVMGAHGAHPF